MSQKSLLISQCLQNDFVKPLGKFASMPNQLHIGGEEARRHGRVRPMRSLLGPMALHETSDLRRTGTFRINTEVDLPRVQGTLESGDSSAELTPIGPVSRPGPTVDGSAHGEAAESRDEDSNAG